MVYAVGKPGSPVRVYLTVASQDAADTQVQAGEIAVEVPAPIQGATMTSTGITAPSGDA